MGVKDVLSPDDAGTKFGVGLWLGLAVIVAVLGGWGLGAFVVAAGAMAWVVCLVVLLALGRRGRRALWDATRYVFGSAQWI